MACFHTGGLCTFPIDTIRNRQIAHKTGIQILTNLIYLYLLLYTLFVDMIVTVLYTYV